MHHNPMKPRGLLYKKNLAGIFAFVKFANGSQKTKLDLRPMCFAARHNSRRSVSRWREGYPEPDASHIDRKQTFPAVGDERILVS